MDDPPHQIEATMGTERSRHPGRPRLQEAKRLDPSLERGRVTASIRMVRGDVAPIRVANRLRVVAGIHSENGVRIHASGARGPGKTGSLKSSTMISVV